MDDECSLLASTRVLETASKMVAVITSTMAHHLVSSLAWIDKGWKDCCRCGIKDGSPLGAALGIDEGSEDCFENGSSDGAEDGSSLLGAELSINRQRV
jgi:hypothetical protein